MADKILETLDDGTPITDELAGKMTTEVYAALDRGAYKVIPNPHGKRKTLKPSNMLLQTELKKALLP
jgi:hypothetical protein